MRRRGNYKFLGKFTYYVPGVGGIFALLAWLLVGAFAGGLLTILLGAVLGPEAVTEYGTVISYPVMFIPPMIYASSKSGANSMNRSGWKLDNNHFEPLGAALCVVLAIAGVLSMGFWTDGIVTLLPEMPERLKDALLGLTTGNFWINFLAVSIFAPVCEEWLCRGMVLRGLLVNTKLKPVWAIMISALFFAFIHLNPWQAIPAFILGCLFGYVYYRTGSLKLTMLMHFVNNTFALVCGHIDALKDMESWKDVMPAGNYAVLASACFLLSVLVFLAYRRIVPQRPEGSFGEVPSLFETE